LIEYPGDEIKKEELNMLFTHKKLDVSEEDYKHRNAGFGLKITNMLVE